MGFSYGTLLDPGHESEARERWEIDFRKPGPVLDAGGIIENEFQMLRAIIRTGNVLKYHSFEVFQIVYPTPMDPEYENWSNNLETEFERTVEMVLPEFLDELCTIPPSEIESIAEQWSGETLIDDPEYFVLILREVIALAKLARSKQMGVFASQYT